MGVRGTTGNGGVEGECVAGHDVTGGASSNVNDIVGKVCESVPVAVLVGVGWVSVPSRANTEVHVLNGPFQVDHLVAVGALCELWALTSVDADKGKSDSANVNIVDFGVNEDVVGVQIDVSDGLCCDDTGASGKSRCECYVLLDVVNSNGGGGSLGSGIIGVLELGGESQEEISRSGEDDLVLVFKLDCDNLLSITCGGLTAHYNSSRACVVFYTVALSATCSHALI